MKTLLDILSAVMMLCSIGFAIIVILYGFISFVQYLTLQL